MNQANTLITTMNETAEGVMITVEYDGRSWTLQEDQHGGTYTGAIDYLGINMPKDYVVSMLPTSARFAW